MALTMTATSIAWDENYRWQAVTYGKIQGNWLGCLPCKGFRRVCKYCINLKYSLIYSCDIFSDCEKGFFEVPFLLNQKSDDHIIKKNTFCFQIKIELFAMKYVTNGSACVYVYTIFSRGFHVITLSIYKNRINIRCIVLKHETAESDFVLYHVVMNRLLKVSYWRHSHQNNLILRRHKALEQGTRNHYLMSYILFQSALKTPDINKICS